MNKTAVCFVNIWLKPGERSARFLYLIIIKYPLPGKSSSNPIAGLSQCHGVETNNYGDDHDYSRKWCAHIHAQYR